MPAGIKKQILGGVLFCLGAMTALLARTIGFELDVFYVVISIFGAGLFLYGTVQGKQQILTSEPQHFCGYCAGPEISDVAQQHRADFTACANLPSYPASIKQKVSVHGD